MYFFQYSAPAIKVSLSMQLYITVSNMWFTSTNTNVIN